MTENYLTNITPDGITGMIFGMEGIRQTVVLLNGPTGCRFYHSTTSQFLSIHPLLYLPSRSGEKVPVDFNYLNNWFFRQQRVPCTWLDGEDYVYGTEEKVRAGILFIKEHIQFDLIAVINSPGASLIGDRIQDLLGELLPDGRYVMLESPGFSTEFSAGYEQACLSLLQQLGKTGALKKREDQRQTAEGAKPRVNVLGLSIWNRYFEGDRKEIERILKLCGIEVNCFLAADCSMDEILRIPEADLNLVLDPQMGTQAAQYLEKEYGMPFYVCDCPPVGFSASEKLCRDLSERLGTDPAEALKECETSRALAWYKINGIYRASGLPKGAVFAVQGSASQVLAYTTFCIEYLGMTPDVLSVTGNPEPSVRKRLEEMLDKHHAHAALDKPIEETQAELVFGDANFIASLMTTDKVFCGIEISLPGMGYTDLIPKTHFGIHGALFLTEQVLNGLMSRL